MKTALSARPEIVLQNSPTFTFASCKEIVDNSTIVREVCAERGGNWELINEDIFPSFNPKSGNYVWMLRKI